MKWWCERMQGGQRKVSTLIHGEHMRWRVAVAVIIAGLLAPCDIVPSARGEVCAGKTVPSVIARLHERRASVSAVLATCADFAPTPSWLQMTATYGFPCSVHLLLVRRLPTNHAGIEQHSTCLTLPLHSSVNQSNVTLPKFYVAVHLYHQVMMTTGFHVSLWNNQLLQIFEWYVIMKLSTFLFEVRLLHY